jgi:hypothetical protein
MQVLQSRWKPGGKADSSAQSRTGVCGGGAQAHCLDQKGMNNLYPCISLQKGEPSAAMPVRLGNDVLASSFAEDPNVFQKNRFQMDFQQTGTCGKSRPGTGMNGLQRLDGKPQVLYLFFSLKSSHDRRQLNCYPVS